MKKIKELLKESSLSNTLDLIEIDDLYEEIKDELEEILEEERERIEEELDIDELEDKIEDLEKNIDEKDEIIETYKSSLLTNPETINDSLMIEWFIRNYEPLKDIFKMNLEGVEITNKFCKCQG